MSAAQEAPDTSIGRNAAPMPLEGRSPLAADGRPILPGGMLWRWDDLSCVTGYMVTAHGVAVEAVKGLEYHNADFLCVRQSEAMMLHAKNVLAPREGR